MHLRSSPVAVVGGGVAGIWAAYKLIKAGIPTTLITYLDKDRGGIQGSIEQEDIFLNSFAVFGVSA